MSMESLGNQTSQAELAWRSHRGVLVARCSLLVARCTLLARTQMQDLLPLNEK
jgi:hypothetical protein